MTPRNNRAESPRRRLPGDDDTHVGDRLVALFGLAVVLFCPLVMRIFDRGAGTTLLGVPLLYFYLFSAWAVVIGLLACAVGPPSARASGSQDTITPRLPSEARDNGVGPG